MESVSMHAVKEAVDLPDDVEALKALIAERDARIAERDGRIANLLERTAMLEHSVEVLRRTAFAPSSEKRRPKAPIDSNAAQGHLFLIELLEEAERLADEAGANGAVEMEPARQAAPGRGKGKRGKRNGFPEHLHRVRTTYELPEDQRQCACGQAMPAIGVELSKRLERVEFCVVHEIARTKYDCKVCEAGALTAPGPTQPFAKSLLGPGMLAHLAVERFAQHMPYYRLEKKYAAEGIHLSRAVLSESAGRTGDLLVPIWRVLGRLTVGSDTIWTDDTPTVTLECAAGGRREGRFWIHRDLEDRHYYTFSESRSATEPERVLKDFRGWMHADGYKGYGRLFVPQGATHVGCWAHARRYFVRALTTDKKLAGEAIERIGELYKIDRELAHLEPAARSRERRRRMKGPLKRLRTWLAVTEAKVLPKSPLGRAVRYTLGQWRSLTRFPLDGRLRLDNNLAENALRRIAVGRKNWLFVGNEHGGQTAAVLMSLIATAEAIGLDARTYLRDVILRMAAAAPQDREALAEDLTPQRWREIYAEGVRDHQLAILERLLEQWRPAKPA
jgi:transposase